MNRFTIRWYWAHSQFWTVHTSISFLLISSSVWYWVIPERLHLLWRHFIVEMPRSEIWRSVSFEHLPFDRIHHIFPNCLQIFIVKDWESFGSLLFSSHYQSSHPPVAPFHSQGNPKFHPWVGEECDTVVSSSSLSNITFAGHVFPQTPLVCCWRSNLQKGTQFFQGGLCFYWLLFYQLLAINSLSLLFMEADLMKSVWSSPDAILDGTAGNWW